VPSRRHLLTRLAALGVGGLAGCNQRNDASTRTSSRATTDQVTPSPQATTSRPTTSERPTERQTVDQQETATQDSTDTPTRKTVVDPCENLDLISTGTQRETLVVDSSNERYFEHPDGSADEGRFKRTTKTPTSVVYMRGGEINSGTVEWHHQKDAGGSVQFYESTDYGDGWSELTAEESQYGDEKGLWVHTEASLSLSEGVNAVLIELESGSQAWSPQVGHVRLDWQDFGEETPTPAPTPTPEPVDLAFSAAPANPDLTETGRAVLSYLQNLPGDGWLAGQQEGDFDVNDEQQYVESVTGHKPALRGFDVAEYIVDPIDEAERSDAEDSQLITFSWHQPAPPKTTSSYENSLASADVEACVTQGTEENEVLTERLAWMADRLEPLRDAGVPVLWRPYHEMDGGWFWWSSDGPGPFKQLWTQMFDYFVEERALDNLIWVWSKSHNSGGGAWYPGDDYVDIAGVDTYNTPYRWDEKYREVADITPSKPVALTETAGIPEPDRVAAGEHPFLWFLPWWGKSIQNLDQSHVESVYTHDYTVTARDLPSL